MDSDKCIIVNCPESKIYKPKPRKLLSNISKRVFTPKDTFLKNPFNFEDLKNNLSNEKELLFKSCKIDDIEKDFCSLKEEREKNSKKSEDSYLRDSTKTNSFEDEQFNYVEITRPLNPFYKNFE